MSSKKASRSHGVETKERILNAAEDLFLEEGYSAASISKIAKRANILTGSLYWAFESKEHLFAEVMRVSSERFIASTLNSDNNDKIDVYDLDAFFASISQEFPNGSNFARLILLIATEKKSRTPEMLAAAKEVRDYWRTRLKSSILNTYSELNTKQGEMAVDKISSLLLHITDGVLVSMAIEPNLESVDEMFLDLAHIIQREIQHAITEVTN